PPPASDTGRGAARICASAVPGPRGTPHPPPRRGPPARRTGRISRSRSGASARRRSSLAGAPEAGGEAHDVAVGERDVRRMAGGHRVEIDREGALLARARDAREAHVTAIGDE